MKLSLTLASLCFVISISAFACNCAVSATPCEYYAFHHGRPTFVGVAVSEATVSDVIVRGNRSVPRTVQKTQFRVEEPFEDIPAEFVDVYGSGTTCDYHFRAGARYLVYGFRESDGKIRTGKCTRTAPLSEATEDLKFLRSLPTRSGGEIFGIVRFLNPQEQTGTIAGAVTASGSDGDHKARVAASGKYELSGLATGDYRLTFTPDDSSTENVQFKVRIPVNGSCVGTGFRLGTTTVSGAVIDQAGSPISGADVFLSMLSLATSVQRSR